MSRSSPLLLQAVVACLLVVCSVVHPNAAETILIPQVLVISSGPGSLTRLQCQNGYEGEVFSARWYKIVGAGNEVEFYRYEHLGNPQKQYPATVSGCHVDADESSGNVLALYDLDDSTSGLYKCVLRRDNSSSSSPSPFNTFNLRVDDSEGAFVIMRAAEANSPLSLKCYIDERADRTYAYKWYKDNQEFYNYVPWNTEHPEAVTPVPFVHVNLQQSNGSHITLDNLQPESVGQYKCEASLNIANTRTQVYLVTVELARSTDPALALPH